MSAGIQSQISFKKETQWGTAVVPDKSIAVRPSGGIINKPNVQLIPAVKGLLAKNHNAIKGKVSYEGDFTMDTFADYVGYFLLCALGTDSPALHSGESTVYDHVYTESVPKPSLTIEQAIGENVRRYAGCLVTGFKLSAKPGEMVELVASIMAKTQATATEITGAFSTVKAFDHTQVQVKIGGSVIGEFENFELEYKNGSEMVYALGSAEPSYKDINGGSQVTFKGDVYLDSTTAAKIANLLSNTHEAVEIVITGGAIG